MLRDKEQLTKTSKILLYLLAAKDVMAPLFAYPTLRKALYPEYERYIADKRLDATLHRLIKQGWIKTEHREAKRFISLTSKGELEALLSKAVSEQKPQRWDGKWRLLMFDIPENTREIRARLRGLLKHFGFYALQASVYVYPYPLQGSALDVFKKSDLTRYIRIARIDSFEDDADLRKYFKVHTPTKYDGRQK